MSKLKNCPFCGGEAAIWDKSRNDTCVKCDKCGARTEWLPTISDAVAAWNRRAQPEPKAVIPNKRIPGIGKCPTCKQELCMDDDDLHYCPTCGTRLMTPGKGAGSEARNETI